MVLIMALIFHKSAVWQKFMILSYKVEKIASGSSLKDIEEVVESSFPWMCQNSNSWDHEWKSECSMLLSYVSADLSCKLVHQIL